tara:strand:- start:1067 stop:1477 length:411 start_codon:yes stop_codon:yes gene_type:complete
MANKTLRIYHNNDNKEDISKIMALGDSDKLKVVSQNIINEPLTATQLFVLKDRLKLRANQLFNEEVESSISASLTTNTDEVYLVEILSKNPSWLKTPIADDGKCAAVLSQPNDVLKLLKGDLSIDGHNHMENFDKK